MRPARLAIAVACTALLLTTIGLLRHQAGEHQISMMRSDPDLILNDTSLRDATLAQGRDVFRQHCSSCHGEDGKGSSVRAVPDLSDSDFLYGSGRVSEIEQIVLHGIRAGDPKGWDLTAMPAFARPVPYSREQLPPLTPAQTNDIVAFLRAANGHQGYDAAQVGRGRQMVLATSSCWDCHGSDGRGDEAIGAPNLLDGKWLRGNGSEAAIRHSIERGMAGISPAFHRTLSPYEARAAAVYVASLAQPIRARTP